MYEHACYVASAACNIVAVAACKIVKKAQVVLYNQLYIAHLNSVFGVCILFGFEVFVIEQ
jgi:hypothetical protein